MILSSPFTPAWWLKNPHMQTVWPTLMKSRVDIALRHERLELNDGDFIDLVWATQGLSKHTPLILMMHGLGGNIHSPYVKSLMKAFNQRGWRVVLMHFRGCGGEPNRLPRAYHSGETNDFNTVLSTLQVREPNVSMAAVGFSLGGNVLLKWLGEHTDNDQLRAAVAVSVPFDLKTASQHMTRGVAQIYQAYMVKQLHRYMRDKFQSQPAPFDLNRMKEWRCFWSFDDNITAPLHGFSCVEEYYAHASAKKYLAHINTHTLIIQADDDPFMPCEMIPSEQQLSSKVCLELCNGGGHVGFITGQLPGFPEYWLDQRIPNFITQTHR